MPNLNVHQRREASDWSTLEVRPLRNGDVSVWRAELHVPAGLQRTLEASLSDDERRRAERFAFERDRTRFIVRRGVLRALLGRQLDADPRHLSFVDGPYGKPALGPPFDGSGLSFSVSHSGGLAVIALGSHRQVGDVEQVRPMSDAEDLARRFFAPAEIASLDGLPPQDRLVGFFTCWTRKEAYVKATGEGLHRALDSFAIPIRPGELPRLIAADPSADGDDWSVHDLVPAPDYVAAVVASGHQWLPRCRTWQASLPTAT